MEVAEGCQDNSSVPLQKGLWKGQKRASFVQQQSKEGQEEEVQKLKACAKGQNIKNRNLWQIKCKSVIKVAKKKDFEEQSTEMIQTNDDVF